MDAQASPSCLSHEDVWPFAGPTATVPSQRGSFKRQPPETSPGTREPPAPPAAPGAGGAGREAGRAGAGSSRRGREGTLEERGRLSCPHGLPWPSRWELSESPGPSGCGDPSRSSRNEQRRRGRQQRRSKQHRPGWGG